MNVGIIGTGAIAHKHALAYKNLGWELVVCTNTNSETGKKFAKQYGAEFAATFEEVCRHPRVSLVDVCTLPSFRLPPVGICAQTGKHVQVQKPIAIDLVTARKMIDLSKKGNICLSVVSQHRFDEASQFLSKAIAAARLGRLIQCDCYVKWYRSPEYYARKGKGDWQTEGGGALINQAIHQVDLLRWFAGPVHEVFGQWQLGGLHAIESEDVVNAVVRYASGATGVIEASTALWPGSAERIEIHGTKGTAVITGDRLTTWKVQDDSGPPAPLASDVQTGAADPMAISLEVFERQFSNVSEAIARGTQPLVSGEDGYRSLEIVEAVYRSCRTQERVVLPAS